MAFNWRNLIERPLFGGEIGLYIAVCRFDALVPEPQRNDRDINAGLEQMGGRRVPPMSPEI